MGSGCKTVAFRVDSSLKIGAGHVMRCLALADGMKDMGAEAVFVCREHEGNLSKLIAERGFRVLGLAAPEDHWTLDEPARPYAEWLGTDWQTDADQTIKALGGIYPDWLIVDHYALDARWEKRLRAVSGRILVIDDLADRKHACDALVDPSLLPRVGGRYEDLVPDRAVQMLGPDYALLRSEYRDLREQVAPRKGFIRRVLVSFGGVDQQGLTRMAVEALMTLDGHEFEAEVVLRSTAPDYSALEQKIATRENFRLHDGVPNLAPMMASADLMVGACGTTSWERLCLGLPAIVVTVADNQRAIAEELAGRKLIRWLGDAKAVTASALQAALVSVFEMGLDVHWSLRCFGVVDGRGVERVCAVLGAHPDMPLVIRQAEQRDEALLLEWVNDAQTRQSAFNARPISYIEHKEWFQGRLSNPRQCRIYIAETTLGVPVGQVRFDEHPDGWHIDYALAPQFRGFRLGTNLLAIAIERLRNETSAQTLVADVLSENVGSIRVLEKLNFSRKNEADAKSIRFVMEPAE